MSVTLEEHKNIVFNKFRRVIDGIVPKKVIPHPKVTVEAGLQHGFSHEFSSDRILIGSGANCDLVLIDEGIAPIHVDVRFEWSAFGTVANVRSNDANVNLDGQPIPAARSAYSTVPTKLQVGPVTLRLDTTKDSASRRSKRWDIISPIGIILAVFLITFLPFSSIPGIPQSIPFAVLHSQAFNDISTQEESGDDSLNALKERLKEHDLLNHISFGSTTGNLLVVEGILPESKMPDWKDVQRWYDGSSQSALLVSKVTVAPELSDFPAISTVRLSDPPEILFMNGQRSGIGDLTIDGWRISKISDTGLELTRNGDSLTIDF